MKATVASAKTSKVLARRLYRRAKVRPAIYGFFAQACSRARIHTVVHTATPAEHANKSRCAPWAVVRDRARVVRRFKEHELHEYNQTLSVCADAHPNYTYRKSR